MSFKYIFFCVSAFLVQVHSVQVADTRCPFFESVKFIAGQTTGSSCGCSSISVSNKSGPLAITSTGPVASTSIAVATDLGLAGDLDISGTLPYQSAVAFEGQFPTSGAAPVSYGCGNCMAQKISNNEAQRAASISSCGLASAERCRADVASRADLPRVLPTAATAATPRAASATQAVAGDADAQQRAPITAIASPEASQLLAQHRLLTEIIRNRQTAGYKGDATGVDIASYPQLPVALPAALATAAKLQEAPFTAKAIPSPAQLAQPKLLHRQPIFGQCPPLISYKAPSCGSSSSGFSSSSMSTHSVAIPRSGGDLLVTSIGSKSSPSIAVASDIGLSGALDVAGALPFMSAVEFQGSYDTYGSGLVSYGCGDSVAIPQELGGPRVATISSCRNQSVRCSNFTTAEHRHGVGHATGTTVTSGAVRTDLPSALPTVSSTAAAQTGEVAQAVSTTVAPRFTQHFLSMEKVKSMYEQGSRRLSYPMPSCGCSSSSSVSANSVAIPSGGDLLINSIGTKSSSGINFASNIGLSGTLDVSGTLPFMSTVEFQGLLDTSGSGSVSHACGDSVAIKKDLVNLSGNNAALS